jgi:hypothetical protein
VPMDPRDAGSNRGDGFLRAIKTGGPMS